MSAETGSDADLATNGRTRRRPTAEDLLGLKFVSDPQLASDGRTVAAVVTAIVTGDTPTGRAQPSDSRDTGATTGGSPTAVAAARGTGDERYGAGTDVEPFGAVTGVGTDERDHEPSTPDAGADERTDDPPHYRSRIHIFTVPAAGSKAVSETASHLGAGSTTGGRPADAARGAWPAHSGDGGREFTRTEQRDSSPRFSPDGLQLAFLRAAEKHPPQLHLMALGGGEPVQLTHHEAGVGEFAWQPNGAGLLYVSRGQRVYDAEKGAGRRITRLRYRADGEGFLPQAAADLYQVDLTGGWQRLTETPDEQAFGDPNSLACSADGTTLYFWRAGDERTYDDFRADLWALDLDSRDLRPLLRGVLGAGDLAVSPSGQRLTYTAASRQDDLASASGLWLLQLTTPPGGAPPRLLTADFDVSPAEASDSRHGRYANRPCWLSGHGSGAATEAAVEQLLVNVHEGGRTRLTRVRLDGSLEELGGSAEGARAVSAFAGHPEGAVAFVAETPVRPGELWFRSTEGDELRLSAVNDEWCERLELRTPAGPFALTGASVGVRAGTAGASEVEYWTLSPAVGRLDDAVVLEVHGGPHTAYGNGFMFEFQLLAAHGYQVVYGNPRGSSSYGHHFATCLLGDYGSIDADDVLAIASAAAARLGLPDSPVHLTGGSYGGFMTNWLIGISDRFRSAVSQRSISNWTSMYGTSDIGPSFVERELCGVPWRDVELLWRQSPLRNAAAIVTPLLLIHSEEDYRCPIEQAEQLFSAIKRQGTSEVELLRFPGEGHELSRSGRPDRRLQRLRAIVDWFEGHA